MARRAQAAATDTGVPPPCNKINFCGGPGRAYPDDTPGLDVRVGRGPASAHAHVAPLTLTTLTTHALDWFRPGPGTGDSQALTAPANRADLHTHTRRRAAVGGCGKGGARALFSPVRSAGGAGLSVGLPCGVML
jgi:hypothetical protein